MPLKYKWDKCREEHPKEFHIFILQLGNYTQRLLYKSPGVPRTISELNNLNRFYAAVDFWDDFPNRSPEYMRIANTIREYYDPRDDEEELREDISKRIDFLLPRAYKKKAENIKNVPQSSIFFKSGEYGLAYQTRFLFKYNEPEKK